MKIHETVMLTLQNFCTFHELFKDTRIFITITSKATYLSYEKIKIIINKSFYSNWIKIYQSVSYKLLECLLK